MALHFEDVVEHNGLTKQIDEGAMSMLFDNLQRSQYQYPMKSTIRELVSNGIDAINEKHIALKILSGEAKVEDYYYVEGSGVMDEAIRTNKGVYKDSSFDPTYYDPMWLDTQNNIVRVEYRVGPDMQRDRLVIIDSGVGLGRNRLEGVLKLGYSTKRLSKNPLGKYGLGAKVALSTGVTFYTMISRYNGQESVFNIYSGHVESVVPHLDTQTNTLNTKHVMANGYEYYTRPTRERNGTEIHVEVKKHMKKDVISAVQNQLLYFPNVSLKVINYDGSETPYPVQAEVLFENDKIIISENDQFSKPHMVINNVSYGYVDFLELELEEKKGNIGIKVSPNEIEVSPSRESVIWSEITRKTIMTRFREVKEIASDYIAKELVEPDFIKWHNLCRAVILRGVSANAGAKQLKVLSTLGQITDLNSISPKYALDKTVKFEPSITKMAPSLNVIKVTHKKIFKAGQTVLKIDRNPHSSLDSELPVFIKSSKFSFRKDMYLMSVYPNGFITVSLESTENDNNLFTGQQAQSKKILDLISGSQGVKEYDSFEVPESYSVREVEEEEESEAEVTESGELIISDKERRKAEGKILARTLTFKALPDGSYSRDGKNGVFTHSPIELVPEEVTDFDEELYYATSDHTPLLHLAAYLMRHENTANTHRSYRHSDYWSAPYWTPGCRVRLLDISAKNRDYFAHNWAHITSFYSRFENGIISMSNQLIKWNTARVIHKRIEQLKFMNSFSSINLEIAEKYKAVKSYHDDNYREIDYLTKNNAYGAEESMIDTLVGHLDKVNDLQMFSLNNPNPTSLLNKVKELFPEEGNPESVKGAVGIDLEVYTIFNELLEYSEPIHTMLNMLRPLTAYNSTLTLDEELEIKQFIEFKTQ